ncbi:MAG: hypothetical protein KKI20_00055, partial [Gammaproteobacteria bacterium]|nr:hypothetical protein [Gammaproteobacteria bacterium]
LSSKYPGLKDRLNEYLAAINSQLSADDVFEQLEWAINDLEIKRALHRIHSFLFLSEKGALPELKHNNLSLEHLDQIHAELSELSDEEKEALLVLTTLDGVKGCAKASEAIQEKGYEVLKDGVPFFFNSMEKAPDIYPVWEKVSKAAKQCIQGNLFYLHLRHLQLGEVPTASLSEFKGLLNHESVGNKVQLMKRFWLLNWFGFAAAERGDEEGPTCTNEQYKAFLNVQSCVEACVENENLQSLQAFYAANVPEEVTDLSDAGKELYGRLVMMLQNDAEAIASLRTLSTNIESAARIEQDTFAEYKLQAVTFLPAVYWKINELASEKSAKEKISLLLKLQTKVLEAVPGCFEKLGRNRTLPLFALSKNFGNALGKFIENPKNYGFELSVDQYVNVTPVLLREEARAIKGFGKR